MATIISCKSLNYDNWHNYSISKDIDLDDENSFEVDILVRVNEWVDPETKFEPVNSGFKIDYDSFEIQFNNHSESEKKMIENWIDIENGEIYNRIMLP